MKVKEYGKKIGIPLSEVGSRLEKLSKALNEQNMAIGADMTYQLEMLGTEKECVKAVTITVYLFQEKDNPEEAEQAE